MLPCFPNKNGHFQNLVSLMTKAVPSLCATEFQLGTQGTQLQPEEQRLCSLHRALCSALLLSPIVRACLLLFIFSFKYLYVCWHFTFMYVCMRAPDPLEPEAQVVESHQMVAGN